VPWRQGKKKPQPENRLVDRRPARALRTSREATQANTFESDYPGYFFSRTGLWDFIALLIFRFFMVLLSNRRYGHSMPYPILRRTRLQYGSVRQIEIFPNGFET
jgi:hypothetical protein